MNERMLRELELAEVVALVGGGRRQAMGDGRPTEVSGRDLEAEPNESPVAYRLPPNAIPAMSWAELRSARDP